MDCSLLGFSVHGISQAIILEFVVQKVPFLLQGIFVTQRSDPRLLHWQAESLPIVVCICQSQSPNSLYSHPFSLWYHLLVLYIWLSISVLQTGSSVPFSRFHIHALIYIFSSSFWLTSLCMTASRAICACVHAKSLQSCPTLCDTVDCTLPGSSICGILQERTLEWVTMTSSRGSSQLRDLASVFYVSCIGKWVLYH